MMDKGSMGKQLWENFWNQGLVLLFLFIFPWIIFPIDGLTIYAIPKLMLNGFLILVFCLGLLFRQIPLKRLGLSDWSCFFLAAFFLWLLASAFLGAQPEDIWLDAVDRFEGLLAFAFYGLLFLLARSSRGLHQLFWWASLGGSSVVALMRIGQYYGYHTLSKWFILGFGPRGYLPINFPYGTFGNPNFFAGFIAMTLPLCLYALLFEKRYGAALALGIQIYALIINRSRGGFLGAMLALIFLLLVFLWSKRSSGPSFWRPALLSVGGSFGFLLLLLLLMPDVRLRFASIFTELAALIKHVFTGQLMEAGHLGSNRVALWMITLQVIGLYPLFGTGIGGYAAIVEEHFSEAVRLFLHTPNLFVDRAHNEFLHIAAQSGLPALLFYLLFLARLIKRGFAYAKDNPRYYALLASVGAYLVYAQLGISLPETSSYLWVLLGLLSHPKTMQKQQGA